MKEKVVVEETKNLELKNSRFMVIFGAFIVITGIAQSLGFIHDLRQIAVHLTGLPLKEYEIAAQAITKSTSLNIGPVIILSGILIMGLGRIADIGAVYLKLKSMKK